MGQTPDSPARQFKTKLYIGEVSHRRLKPVGHHFKYKVFSALFDLDELPELGKNHRWFSHNRLGLLSFYDKDHGPKTGAPLRPWIEQQLRKGGYDFLLGAVKIHCFPRILGFVFNPISVWFIYDSHERLRAVLHEVRNTQGQWRGYLLPVDANRDEKKLIRQECDKTFYVSPLMEMNCHYHFTLQDPGDYYSLAIRETQNGEKVLLASHTGKARDFTDGKILKTFASHPLQFFKVVIGIHFEALRILLKGVSYKPNPQSQNGDVTFPKNEIEVIPPGK